MGKGLFTGYSGVNLLGGPPDGAAGVERADGSRIAGDRRRLRARVKGTGSPTSDGPTDAGIRGRVGTYSISASTRMRRNVVLRESHAGLRLGGFAYLPDGPDPALELGTGDTRFVSLGGHWYAFNADAF